MLALKIAVGRFPLAIATITTEDETVDGNTPKKNTESHNSDCVPSAKTGIKRKVNKGKSKNVEICIRRCALKFRNPSFNSSGASFNP